jgi:hypothetical protein
MRLSHAVYFRRTSLLNWRSGFFRGPVAWPRSRKHSKVLMFSFVSIAIELIIQLRFSITGTDKVRARRSSISASEVLGESIVTDGILTRSMSANHPKIRSGLSTSKILSENCTGRRVLRSGDYFRGHCFYPVSTLSS